MMPLLIALMSLAAADPAKSCNPPPGYAHLLTVESAPARQGATLKIQAWRGLSFMGENVPLRCTSGWKVSNPRAVKLSRDRKSLTIAKDASPGELVTISYVVRGERESATIRIVGRGEMTLTGTYRLKTLIGCRQNDHIGELKFTDAGRFSVTYQPFETYTDYWGTFKFDSATGKLDLKIEGGNFVPWGTRLSGKAWREPGKLLLGGFDFGGRHPTQRDVPSGDCTYEF